MVSKKEKKLRFQVKKSIDNFSKGLMVFTIVWKSLIKVFIEACEEKNVKKMLAKGVGHSCTGVGYNLDEVRNGANFADMSSLVLCTNCWF